MHDRGDGFGFGKIATVDVFADAMGSVARTGVSNIDTDLLQEAGVRILEPANHSIREKNKRYLEKSKYRLFYYFASPDSHDKSV